MRLSVTLRTQNASFRRMRFSSPGQTWRHLTERRTLGPSPHGKTHSGPAASRKSAVCGRHPHGKPQSGRLGYRGVRFSVTSRRLGGVGQPPARLRGTMENASTGQMRPHTPPPGCGAGCARVRKSRFRVWSHGKVHSEAHRLGRVHFSVTSPAQSARFRDPADAECAFS